MNYIGSHIVGISRGQDFIFLSLFLVNQRTGYNISDLLMGMAVLGTNGALLKLQFYCHQIRRISKDLSDCALSCRFMGNCLVLYVHKSSSFFIQAISLIIPYFPFL